MYIQPELFNTEEFDITPKLSNLRTSIRFGWNPFVIDNLEKAGKMYNILCAVIWQQYDLVLVENNYEQPSNNSVN